MVVNSQSSRHQARFIPIQFGQSDCLFSEPFRHIKIKNFRRDKLSNKSLSKYLFVQKSALSENLSRRKFSRKLCMHSTKSRMKFYLSPTISHEKVCNSLSEGGPLSSIAYYGNVSRILLGKDFNISGL